MKNEHLHVKSQTSSPFRKTAVFLVFICGQNCTHYMTGAGLGTDELILLALLLEVVRVLSTEMHAESPFPNKSELPAEAWTNV